METFFIPNENDIKRWIKEAVFEYAEMAKSKEQIRVKVDEELLSRKEVASRLKISLTTLHDWVNRGLPAHKQRGRVYFNFSEVSASIKRSNKVRFLRPL